MSNGNPVNDLYGRLTDLPLVDAHTHLVGGKLGARGLHDILLYHMAVSDLYAAGCPSGGRLTEYPGWPDRAEAHARITEALPHLSKVQNTSVSWGIRIILRDLYGWDEPITQDNWKRLDDRIRERADDRAWHRDVMGRANIECAFTELARREGGVDDDILHYSLEWAFFTRCQWGEYDTALYELERCWGEQPASPTPIGVGKRPETRKRIQSVEDVHEAAAYYADVIPYDLVKSNATHFSMDLDLSPVSREEMADALTRREQAGPRERDIYASYVNEAFMTAMEDHPRETIFQFSHAAEPLPFETASRISQRSLAQVAEIISRHPGLQFQCHVSSRHANQTLCTMCRELPNLTLVGFWWHNFFPSIIRSVMQERLDMLPLNRQIGFFSDAYCIEWAYAKTRIVLRQYAEVLAGKIRQGQYTEDDAVNIVRTICNDTVRAACGI